MESTPVRAAHWGPAFSGGQARETGFYRLFPQRRDPDNNNTFRRRERDLDNLIHHPPVHCASLTRNARAPYFFIFPVHIHRHAFTLRGLWIRNEVTSTHLRYHHVRPSGTELRLSPSQRLGEVSLVVRLAKTGQVAERAAQQWDREHRELVIRRGIRRHNHH